jgi:hypothetical protein
MDQSSVNKFFDYNLNKHQESLNTLNINRLDLDSGGGLVSKVSEGLINNFSKTLPHTNSLNSTDFLFFLKVPNLFSVLSTENDSKQYSNTFKFVLNTKYKKKSIQNFDFLLSSSLNPDITNQNLNPNNMFYKNLYNTTTNYKFKDCKSSNAQFLGSERTVRLLNNLNSNSYKWNISATSNLPTSLTQNLLEYGNSQNYLYSSSLSN